MSEVPALPPLAASSFAIVDLNERVVVYDRRSGRTHLLDALTAEVFRLIASAPELALQNLRETLAAHLGISSAELPIAPIDDALHQLRSAGLVA